MLYGGAGGILYVSREDPTLPRFDGADVSHWQGRAFPWQWCRDTYDTQFSGCKMTEGTKFVDSTGLHNRAAMKETGHRWRGLYHYAQAGDPQANADHFAKEVGELEIGEFVFLDVESGMTPEVRAVVAMLEAFETLYPGRVADYQGYYFANGDSSAYDPWPWIIAAYRKTLMTTRRHVVVWQWGGGAEGIVVPGMRDFGSGQIPIGHVDSNEVEDAVELDRICGIIATPVPVPGGPGQSHPIPIPVPIPTPPTDEEDDMAALWRITSPTRAAEVVRFGSGLLGWANHAESVPDSREEPDEAAFVALMQACTVPPIPADQQEIRK